MPRKPSKKPDPPPPVPDALPPVFLPRGRPGSLTPEVQRKILETIRKGNYRVTAARVAGITAKTLCGWMRLGRAELAEWKRAADASPGRPPDPPADGTLGYFCAAVMQAEAEAEARAAESVHQAGASDPKFALAWLERKFPGRWSGNRDLIRQLARRVEAMEAERGRGAGPAGP